MVNGNKETAIKVCNIVKDYGHVVALDNVSLDVTKGEIYGLLGPNGAGKTTLIRILAGLIRPTAGSIWLSGICANKQPAQALKKTGFVMDSTAAYPFLSGRQNLEAVERMLHDKQQITVEQVLSIVGLLENADRPVSSYSLGMKRRLDIGIVFLRDLDVFILDEPTSGLDPNGTSQIHQLLLEMIKIGKTVLFSSHQLQEVQQLCKRVAILNKGRIVAEGFLNDLLRSWPETVRMRFAFVERAKEALSSMPDSPLKKQSNDVFTIDISKHTLSDVLAYLEQHAIRPIDITTEERLDEYFKRMTEERNE
jgi:ABC-2 type transport system ATP-binding protein